MLATRLRLAVIRLLSLIACAIAGEGAIQTRSGLDGQPVSLVVMFDITTSTIDAIAPFVWDGSHDPQGRLQASGTRPPHRPTDLFLPAVEKGVAKWIGPTDEVFVGRISQTPKFEPAGSGPNGILRAAKTVLEVELSEQCGRTPIWDAIDEAVFLLDGAIGKKAIIVVTDGMPMGNRVSLADATSHASREKVIVHSILEPHDDIPGQGFKLVDSSNNPWIVLLSPFGTQPLTMLRALSAETGGQVLIDGRDGSARQLDRLLADLMQQVKG